MNEEPKIRRAANGRPYIYDPEKGKEVTYTRISTFAKAMSDGDALSWWRMKTMVKGMAMDPSLINVVIRAVAEAGGDIDSLDVKPALEEVVARASDLGGANAAAQWGTTIHAFADIIDFTDETFAKDRWALTPEIWDTLDAYVDLTKDMKMLSGEQFVVCDQYRAAGSYDRTLEWGSRIVVGDLKTGAVRMPDHVVQTALYSRSKGYDLATGARIRGPVDVVDQKVGLIVHLPRPGVKDGRGNQVEPSIIPVDLEEGWKLAGLADEVRKARSAKLVLAEEEMQ